MWIQLGREVMFTKPEWASYLKSMLHFLSIRGLVV